MPLADAHVRGIIYTHIREDILFEEIRSPDFGVTNSWNSVGTLFTERRVLFLDCVRIKKKE